jgi:hypothetical protein
MWAEAMNKLEGMDSNDRERLWPELVHGFKDLSRRVKVMFSLNPFCLLNIDIKSLMNSKGFC